MDSQRGPRPIIADNEHVPYQERCKAVETMAMLRYLMQAHPNGSPEAE